MKQWMMRPNQADLKKIAERYRISEIFAEVLVKRGLYDWETMDSYLFPKLKMLHPALDMKDMGKAVSILKDKIAEGKRIKVIGDYDADGVMSATILIKGLKAAGAEVCWKLPHRVRDGYGIRAAMAEEAKEQGVDTIITCDNGISAVGAVKRAKELGMTVIVTDHHEVPVEARGDGEEPIELLPPADAIVDPKQTGCTYPFRDLCGAGIAYRLVEVLLGDAFVGEVREELLALAAIATVCDVVPLREENRTIVKLGLKYIGGTKNPGLSALVQQLKLGRGVTSGAIGFQIGPCINAAGRLKDASLGVKLLMEKDEEKAGKYAEELIQLNEERKALTEKATEQAVKVIEEEKRLEQKVLVIYVSDCPESVAGIVAGRIREKYYRPVMILTDSGDKLKGSGRSIPGYHMQQELNACKELLIEYGGHAMAAGFSLEKEKLSRLNEELNQRCKLEKKDLVEKITLDREVPLKEISGGLVRELELLEPVGESNPPALFAKRKLQLLSVRLVGPEKTIGNIQAMDEGKRFTLVDFDVVHCLQSGVVEKYSETMWENLLSRKAKDCYMDILYRPSINKRYETLEYVVIDCR